MRAVLVTAAAFPGPTLAAQEPPQEVSAGPNGQGPRVESIQFVGAQSLPQKELRASIVTQETHCRGAFLLKPFCILGDWSALVEKEYLDPRELPRDELRLEVLYFRRGYRQATVTTEVTPHKKGVQIVFNIAEGPPLLVESLEVTQTEPLLSDRAIRRAMLPSEGEPLDLIRLEAAKIELSERLGQQGYLDAEVRDSIDLTSGNGSAGARVGVTIDPNRRSTLEGIEIDGNEKINERIIADAVRLRMGRVLRSTDILASQRSLYESNLFHEARVQLPPQPDSAKTLQINVREAPPRAARVSGGFNTIEFLQLEARYTHYNFMGKARRLDFQGAVGNLLASTLNGKGIFLDVLPPGLPDEDGSPFLEPTWQVSTEFMQPGFLSADNRAGFGLFAHRRSLPGIVVDDGYGASVSLTRRLDYLTPASLEYRFETTEVQAGDLYFCVYFGVCDFGSISVLRGNHTLSPLALAFFSDHSDDPLSPKSGYRVRVDLEHASAATVSDFRYNRASAEATGYIPLGLYRNRVISGRLRVGWVGPLSGTAEALGVDVEGLALVHPRRRFFAGGARSVRGFGENQLGPRVLTVDPAELLVEDKCTVAQVSDGSCDPNLFPVDAFIPRPLGGSSVLEASVEYRFPLFGPFVGAAFLDGALVSGTLEGFVEDAVGAVTPGVGIRYQSPIVPIRVDVGYRPALSQLLPVFTEVVDANGESRLVRLAQPRLYDPVGDATGGFLGGIFSHLRLHVWIGEAF